MTCQDCEIYLLAQGEISREVEEHLHHCAECPALSQDLRANALALESLRNEELPRLAVKIPRRRHVYPWAVYRGPRPRRRCLHSRCLRPGLGR